jgi:hypothetical protein
VVATREYRLETPLEITWNFAAMRTKPVLQGLEKAEKSPGFSALGAF